MEIDWFSFILGMGIGGIVAIWSFKRALRQSKGGRNV